MKNLGYAVIVFFLGPVLPALAALTLNPASQVYLSGDSTLHPYSSTSTLTQVTAELSSGSADLKNITLRAPFQKFEVIIPVKGLKSGESGLDKNMYKALKAEKAPDIHFTLGHYEVIPSTVASGFPFKASGQLSIAGVQKDVTLTGMAQPDSDALRVDGQYDLLMTDYGIKPPKLLMGAIKVANPVIVHYHLLFKFTQGEKK
jgi:polyisoprenoid-binding protein YceI